MFELFLVKQSVEKFREDTMLSYKIFSFNAIVISVLTMILLIHQIVNIAQFCSHKFTS